MILENNIKLAFIRVHSRLNLFARNPYGLVSVFLALLAIAPLHAADERPNFLWIIAEDISPLFGCYGDRGANTPHLDALAQRSHLFKKAFATAPVCSPSRSALASGVYPTSLGTQHMFSDIPLPERIDPVMRILKRNGYFTTLRGKACFNFDEAGLFDYWKQDTAPWRQVPADKPFFAYMNLGQTHEGPGNSDKAATEPLSRLPADAKHEPAKVELPPYYPDTPEMRRIWARYLDLITVWDQDVKEVLEQLESDGRAEDTIVFVLADHGMGLPRYKRWINKTGLHVPLIVHVPEKFRHLAGGSGPGTVHEQLVSLLDLPATVLEMAGIERPDYYSGQSLFSEAHRDALFGARDRLDDLPDLSRSVFDGRYHYIRHFQPHLVPMRPGVIMAGASNTKESHRELLRVHEAGEDTEESAKLWSPRPFEELYDLQEDPHELHNIADKPEQAEVRARLAKRLNRWILETRDTGFATELEMMRRSRQAGEAPFTWAQDSKNYPLKAALEAAEAASSPGAAALPSSEDPILNYWAVQQRLIRGDRSAEAVAFFEEHLGSESPAVRLAAAEGLAKAGEGESAVPVLLSGLTAEEPWVRMQAARSLAVSLSPEDLRPLESEMRKCLKEIDERTERARCREWAVSTVQALHFALIKSGLETAENLGR